MDRKHSRQIPTDILKRLLTRSGNQCAFPGCNHPIVDDNDLFVAQLCHIEAVSPNGQRYNPSKTDEETNSYENLLFLCYRHHKETDIVERYPVEKLKAIKTKHEANFQEATYNYSKKVLEELAKEINSYWQSVEEAQNNHVTPEFKLPIDINRDILSLIGDIDQYLSKLYDTNVALMEMGKIELFEYTCLALPNFLSRTSVAVNQIEIKYIEELLLKNPDDKILTERLNYLRDRFKRIAQSAGVLD